MFTYFINKKNKNQLVNYIQADLTEVNTSEEDIHSKYTFKNKTRNFKGF